MTNDPFTVLGVGHDADDEAMHRAYVEQLRKHPPERDPERFQEIRSAFEQLKTERDRIRYRFFSHAPPDASILRRHLLTPGEPQRASEMVLMNLLESALRAWRMKWDS